jgi:hypothetical protein
MHVVNSIFELEQETVEAVIFRLYFWNAKSYVVISVFIFFWFINAIYLLDLKNAQCNIFKT